MYRVRWNWPGMPYTGSGVLGSALSMDKYRSKQLCRQEGIPTPDSELVFTTEQAQMACQRIGLPVVIKPTFEGSSIGVSMINCSQQIVPAFHEARRYGAVLVERRMPGQEVTATILNNECLPLVSMQAQGEFYDYAAKYLSDDTQYVCPAKLPENVEQIICSTALQVFDVLSCSGWGPC